ncbi:MAG: methyltransferase domain-containing protein [Chloroflexi bacterium]|nr:methyltransferase domain-containing protein [Chloroflexota bacterium]
MTRQLTLTTEAVRRYYEQNTRLFLSLGSSPATQTIHRSVWAEGVNSLETALNYTNGLILDQIVHLIERDSLSHLFFMDLGCGVGGSLFYLLQRLNMPLTALGLTLSPLQARLARRHAARLNLLHACSFVEGDFLAVPARGGADIAYSVEAFVHAASAEGYFAQVARLLRPGGRLILADDFRGTPLSSLHFARTSARNGGTDGGFDWLEAFQQGWHAPNLIALAQAESLARDCGLRLIANHHLTPHLRLRALPDSFAAWLLSIGRRLPWSHAIVPSMIGSMALQQCLKMGLIEYRCLMFEKD